MKDELIVFVRIALYIIAGRLVAGGWLPVDMQSELLSQGTVEAVSGALVAIGALIWYWASKARQALRVALDKSK